MMSSNHKILNISRPDLTLQEDFAKELGISKITAQLLINRGIRTAADAEKFLNVKLEHLHDPYQFRDMPRAIELIQKAKLNKDKVMIFGDYDVDGITAIALLKNTLAKIGIDALHYLPHRIKEGYGLNKNILQIAKQKKIKLLITVDCGINSHAQVKELRRHNIEVIITDHHEPLNCELPAASAIINPKIKEAQYKYRDLAGVGVAYKLCQALTGVTLAEELDLVSLGTIADVVPLTGENRIISKIGLQQLCLARRLGLKALIEESGLKNREINSTFVSYILGPRINASGRMDTAEISLDLLLSKTESQAKDFAQVVEAHNRQRQKIEDKILEEALALIEKEVNFKEHKVIVIGQEGWHQGVLGIVAAKLADRFYRPVIAISVSPHLCKGSCRSIKNFHLFQALLACREFLETFGGHAHAAGIVINRNKIEEFKKSINRFAHEKLLLEDLIPSLDVDMEVGLADWVEAEIRELQRLEPYGSGNHEPLFYTRNLKLKGQPQTLSKSTLKFWVTDGSITCEAIAFRMESLKESLIQAEAIDLVYTPRIDNWQGENSLLLEVKDIFFR
ncbi:MAG: single-stranded-DNA-specific exonuclease RecJ [Candidatus Omnitrophica bacterium]|nr:single-stranded-DNA-specific exonuclease RecJ [Candidatus Omnitrophota bacterium]